MANDDDILTAPVPEPDAEPTAAERAHAKAFAELVDKALVGGNRMPPAMSAEDRALLEVATVIRACSEAPGLALAASKQRSIVEDALRQAVGGNTASRSLPGVRPITSARKRRWVPWAIAGASTMVAAAAVVLLWLRAPNRPEHVPPVADAAPQTWRSRPADPLIGEIKRAKAGDASARLDKIFSDRLDGYRERRLSGGRP